MILANEYDERAMQAVAAALGRRLMPGDVVTLQGEMGAGKTSFAQGLIRAIAMDAPEVTSPTYTLMQSYDVAFKSGKGLLWHMDLYRLTRESELDQLGLEELLPQALLIEWPEIALARLPGERLDITIAFAAGGAARRLGFSGNDAWRKRLEGIA